MKATKIIGVAILILIAVGLLPATRDELKWRFASSRDKAQDYAEYLAGWPSGRHFAEGRTRYEERGWAEAQAGSTVESYQQYEQTHPSGTHLADARTRIEDLTWQQSTTTKTIRALQTYLQAYPQGRFLADARTEQAALQTNESAFSTAFQKGTEGALRQFLTDFPNHLKEAEAKQALKDITEGRDIVDLLAEKKIEIQTQGSGIQNVSVRMRKLVPYPLTVRIPTGGYFVSARQSSQNMITTADSRVRLTGDDWQSVSPSAACANRPRDIPGSSDSFTVQRSPHQQELAALMPILDKAGVDYATRQAAVWIVTDDASYADLGILVTRSAYSGSGGSRTIHERETAQAMMLCEQAGVDLARRRIWNDRIDVLAGLADQRLKTWIEGKGGSLIEGLKDKNPQVRRAAAQKFARLRDEKAIEPLIAVLSDADSEVRFAAANALGNMKASQAVEPLIATLKDQDYSTRTRAATALASIGDHRAVQPLIDMLKSGTFGRGTAAYALGLLKDKQAVEPIIESLKIEDWDVRQSGAFALGELGDSRAVEPLIQIIDYRINSVPEAAAKALVKLTGDTNGMPKGYKNLEAVIEYWKAYGRQLRR